MTGGTDRPNFRLSQLLAEYVDRDWYRSRYPDIAVGGLDPVQHFVQHGLAEQRDPNPLFDGAWYVREHPEAAASGTQPLLHYLFSGAPDCLDPHPQFDAGWYVECHPEAAGNPLLFHLRHGRARGFDTRERINIQEFLPSPGPARVAPADVRIDVIIALRDGGEQARRCIAAVLDRSGPSLGRVIVVESGCTRTALLDWLRGKAAEGRLIQLQDHRRIGFTVAVNRGLGEAAGHDAVLLDAGTDVPEGWLLRLAAQAYAAPKIACVSPLLIRTLPAGKTAAEVDLTCQRINSGRFATVPSAVGSCVYLRNSALREVGLLDSDAFSTGSGAVIDFCLRATARGWSHRLACDTLVHQTGEPACGDRDDDIPDARVVQLIRARHPAYGRVLARHRRRGAATPYWFALSRALAKPGLPTILMISHALGGGVQLHIASLAARLQSQATVLVLKCARHHHTLSWPTLPNHPPLVLAASEHDDLIAVLRAMGVTRLHIHHTLASGLDIRMLVERLEVPFDVTVHDYYAICPQRNLLPWEEGLYCGEPGPARCNACIADSNDVEHGARDILSWRLEHAWPFLQAQRVLCPSEDVRQRLARFDLADRAVLAPHEANTGEYWPSVVPRLNGPVLRIAVLGVLANLKGGRMVAAVAGTSDYAIHLVGHTDQNFPAAALRLIRQTGPYDEAELPGLIRQSDPHVIWFPSTAPETYSYTLSAAIETGLPIVATQLGAFPERLSGRPLTWLTPPDASPAAVIGVFAEVRKTLVSPPRIAAVRRAATADFYARDYLAPAPPRGAAADGKRILALPARQSDGGVAPNGYLRLLQPLTHPAINGEARLLLGSVSDFARTSADVLVVQPAALPTQSAADALIAHARRSGSTLVLDLEADPDSDPVARTLAEAADIIWLATAELARQTAGTLLTTRLDERLWLPPTHPATRWAEATRILWLAGDASMEDLALIAPALTQIMKSYADRVAVDVIGWPLTSEAPPGLNLVRPPTLALRSAPSFTHWLRSVQPAWHLGLAPLQDAPARRTDRSIRLFEYAALGLPILASDVTDYRRSIAEGVAGQLVANTPAAWHAAIGWMLRDEANRHALASRARQAFEETGTLVANAQAWRAAVQAALGYRSAIAAAGQAVTASVERAARGPRRPDPGIGRVRRSRKPATEHA